MYGTWVLERRRTHAISPSAPCPEQRLRVVKTFHTTALDPHHSEIVSAAKAPPCRRAAGGPISSSCCIRSAASLHLHHDFQAPCSTSHSSTDPGASALVTLPCLWHLQHTTQSLNVTPSLPRPNLYKRPRNRTNRQGWKGAPCRQVPTLPLHMHPSSINSAPIHYNGATQVAGTSTSPQTEASEAGSSRRLAHKHLVAMYGIKQTPATISTGNAWLTSSRQFRVYR